MIGRIAIDALRVDCVIGCYDAERTDTQTIQVHLWIDLDIQSAADTDRLATTLDYSALSQQVVFILQSGRFKLLESAARMLLRYLLLPPAADDPRPAVHAASVSLTKFGVLSGQATPCLTLTSEADALTWHTERHAWGQRDVIDESDRLRLCRLRPASGAAAPAPKGHHQMPIEGGQCVLSVEPLRG
jgi:dihydroneopterin aldolase